MKCRKSINNPGLRFAKACVRWKKTESFMDLLDPTYLATLKEKMEAGKLIDVGGSYGHLIVNHKGHIVGWKDHEGWCKKCPKEYRMIRLFDVACYLKHSTDQFADITELSDWDKKGKFTPFSKQTRKRVKQRDSHL